MNPNNKTNFSTTQQIFTHYNDDFLARYGNINPNINNIKKNLSQSCMDCSLDTEPTERTRLLEETAIEAKLKKSKQRLHGRENGKNCEELSRTVAIPSEIME